MDFFQIVEVSNIVYNNSGNKVVADIANIADKKGFKKIKIINNESVRNIFDRLKRKFGYFLDWMRCYNQVTDNSIVLLQHPLHVANVNVLKKLKYKKNIRYISVIIDIEELRQFYYKYYHRKEFETMLEIADVLIVHNDIMADFLLKKGISKEKIITIETFDYLQENNNIAKFDKSISFAGNLDIVKCGFIKELNKLRNIKINLYGSNLDTKFLNYANIEYHGSFPVDEITKKLNKGFGLVWDGDSIASCSGVFGEYLKYNNPHKLSLYLSCGLPVVIWSQAAQARFVKKYNVGICVESLKEAEHIISNMSENDYKILQNSVNKIKPLLCSGYFASNAIDRALNLLKIK